MVSHLEVKNLENHKDGFSLQNISLDIEEGEILLLGGKNSSGKTTLLETICLIHKPDDGRLKFFGKKVFEKGIKSKHWRKVKERIGVQFQSASLFRNLTVRETFELFSKDRRLAEMPDVVDECHFLDNFMDKRIAKLSKGKVQLVKFMLAVMHRPDLVLLDEPVSNLDGNTRDWVYKVIKEMKSEGTSFLITLNSLWSIAKLSESLMILDDGTIYRTVKDFYRNYEGYTAKVSKGSDINSLKSENWILGIEELNDFYLVHSEQTIDKMIDMEGISILGVRDVRLEDFYPGGKSL